MTMSAMTLVNSEQYWRYDPWTYHMTSTMVDNVLVQAEAKTLSSLLGGVIFIFGTVWLGRREVLA